MRIALLPVAKIYLAYHQSRKFSPADNERHFYRDLPEETRSEAAARWRGIEGSLFEALAIADPQIREALLYLLVRGKQIFLRRPVRHTAPFTAIVDQALAATADRLPVQTVTELRMLRSVFPAPVLARLKLQTDLYEIAQLGRRYTPHIKEPFIEYLMREAPAVMRAMPGYKPARSQGTGKVKFLPLRDEPSSFIHKLVQRDALARFEFLSVRQPSDQLAADENQGGGQAATAARLTRPAPYTTTRLSLMTNAAPSVKLLTARGLLICA